MNVSFRNFIEKDLLLLKQWLREPYVQEFWQEIDGDVKLKNKYIYEHPKRVIATPNGQAVIMEEVAMTTVSYDLDKL
jgi:hypothetical protein